MRSKEFIDLATALRDVKQRFKMYKDGKSMLYAAITLTVLVLGTFGLSNQTVSAAAQGDSVPVTETEKRKASVSFKIIGFDKYRNAIWQIQLSGGTPGSDSAFTIDVPDTLTSDEASGALTATNVGNTNGQVWQHYLTINGTSAQALKNRIAAEYPNYTFVWPTAPTQVTSKRTTASKTMTVQPVNANNKSEKIGEGISVTYSRSSYTVIHDPSDSYIVPDGSSSWTSSKEFTGMTIARSAIPNGYTATDANLTISPDSYEGQSIASALQDFANDSADESKTVYVPIELTPEGKVPDTDPQGWFKEQVPGNAPSVSNADYYDYTAEGELPDDNPQSWVHARVPEDAPSVTNDHYYDYTAEGKLPDANPHYWFKAAVPTDSPSVTPDDYYDYTAKGEAPGTDPQIRTEVPTDSPSVTTDDYYDYTVKGEETATNPQSWFKAAVPTDSPSVTKDDYYDYTAKGEEPATDPQIRVEVPTEAPSVTLDGYYDNTAKGEEPDTDPQIRAEVSTNAPSVTTDDYYDYTATGEESDTDPQIWAQVPTDSPSVRLENYYDYITKGEEPDTDPQVRTAVPSDAPSVRTSDYYDKTVKGEEPATDPQIRTEVPLKVPSVKVENDYDNRQQSRKQVMFQELVHRQMLKTKPAILKTQARTRAGSTLPQTGDDDARLVTLGGILITLLVGSAVSRRGRKAE